jgi:hypothetical protein
LENAGFTLENDEFPMCDVWDMIWNDHSNWDSGAFQTIGGASWTKHIFSPKHRTSKQHALTTHLSVAFGMLGIF